MFCTNCGAQVPDDTKFCTSCGARLAGVPGAAPAGAPAPAPAARPAAAPVARPAAAPAARPVAAAAGSVGEPLRKSRAGAIIAAVVIALLLALAGISVAGYHFNWLGFQDTVNGLIGLGGEAEVESDTQADPATAEEPDENVSATGITIRESVNDYSWAELSQISAEIGQAADAAAAIQVAHGYNLCGPNGELASMPSKEIKLSNGTVLHARVIGIYHDQRAEGGTAGLSFLFDEVVALNAWNQSGRNDGGWQASSVRSWLSMTFLPTLPQDLQDALVTVNKRTNNTGGVDSGSLDPSVVTVTPDKLWLPSHVELAGNGPEDVHWAVSHYGTQYTWCNDITSDEGTQYDLFSEIDAQGFAANSILVRTYEGQARKWWMRSPNPHFTYVSLTVAEDGALDGDVGSIESQGVVPGFCV